MINFLITNLDLSNLLSSGYVLSSLGIFSILGVVGTGYLLKSKLLPPKSNNNLNYSNDVRYLEKNLMDDLDLIDDIDDSSTLTDTTLKQITDNTLNKSFNDLNTSPIFNPIIEFKDKSTSPILPIIEFEDVGISPILSIIELKDVGTSPILQNRSFNDVSISPILKNVELKDVSISPIFNKDIELKDVSTSPILSLLKNKSNYSSLDICSKK
jgi:hypothetical protein